MARHRGIDAWPICRPCVRQGITLRDDRPDQSRQTDGLARSQADGKDGALERSFPCPGFMIPPYLSLRLSRAERARLSHATLPEASKVQHDLDRPLRIFFENGMELCITPGTLLEIRALYHAHPWLVGKRPRLAAETSTKLVSTAPIKPPLRRRAHPDIVDINSFSSASDSQLPILSGRCVQWVRFGSDAGKTPW